MCLYVTVCVWSDAESSFLADPSIANHFFFTNMLVHLRAHTHTHDYTRLQVRESNHGFSVRWNGLHAPRLPHFLHHMDRQHFKINHVDRNGATWCCKHAPRLPRFLQHMDRQYCLLSNGCADGG